MAGEGDTGNTPGEQGGKGGDDGDKNKGGMDKEVLGKLAEGLNVLAGEMKEMKVKINQPPPNRGEEEEEDDEGEGDKGGGEGDLDERTLEGMSRKEFANFLTGKFEKVIGKQFKEVLKKTGKIEKTVTAQGLRTQVQEIISKPENADFFEWSEEIKEIAQENPGISVKRAYNLARMENPEKAAKLKEKYHKEGGEGDKDKPGESGKGGAKPRKMGGLLPSSGVEHHTEKMDKQTAAQKAWDQVVGGTSLGGE